jgi:hypothetical protein
MLVSQFHKPISKISIRKISSAGSKKLFGVYRLISTSIGSEWVKLKPPYQQLKFDQQFCFFIDCNNKFWGSKKAASKKAAGPPPIIAICFFWNKDS